MFLQLPFSSWDMVKFVLREDHKDYDHFEKNDNLIVFIYGYPFKEGRWLSAENTSELYSDHYLDFINDIDGIYSIIILDRIKGKCFVITDRYGIYTMFYFKNADFILISDTISEIIPYISSITFNHQRMIEYLHFGYKLGNGTFIESILEFESAKIYEIDKALEIKEQLYWDFFCKSKEDKIPQEDLCEIFNGHIRTALNLEERISLPLTGGIDTRTILSACLPEKDRLHCYTHGIPNTKDIRLAQKICKHFDIEHTIYELTEEWVQTIPSMFQEHSELFNGLVAALRYFHVKESYQKEESKGDLFLSGMLGNEIWRCFFGNQVANCKSRDDVAFNIAKRVMANDKLNSVYRGHNREELLNLIKSSVKDELVKAQNVTDPVNLSEYFVLRNYCSNWAGNNFKAAGRHFKIFPPFLNKDIIPQIPLMDLSEKRDGSLQKHIIARNSSYLANLFSDTGATVNDVLTSRFKHYGKTALQKTIFGRSVVKVLNSLRKKDKSPDYFVDYATWLRHYHKLFLLAVLSYDRMLTKDLFRKSELEKVINLFLDGDNSLCGFIMNIVSLEMWLKVIACEKVETVPGN